MIRCISCQKIRRGLVFGHYLEDSASIALLSPLPEQLLLVPGLPERLGESQALGRARSPQWELMQYCPTYMILCCLYRLDQGFDDNMRQMPTLS